MLHRSFDDVLVRNPTTAPTTTSVTPRGATGPRFRRMTEQAVMTHLLDQNRLNVNHGGALDRLDGSDEQSIFR